MKKWLVLGLLLIVAGCGQVPIPSAFTPVPAPTHTNSPIEIVTVERVIDGDTFAIRGERIIRVLGIDSCEKGTKGYGSAKANADTLLRNGSVSLSSETGVGKDRFKRELKYVKLSDGRDFGSVMVSRAHTEVYKKRNDASAGYISSLRAIDQDGRNCNRG